MKKEKMIEVIYEKIANKELSFGCIIKVCGGTSNGEITSWAYGPIINIQEKFWTKTEGLIGKDRITIIDERFAFENKFRTISNDWGDGIYKIIGHYIMIGDVLDYIQDDEFFETIDDIQLEFMQLWNEKRKPIENQSEECIQYLYNLIK